MSENAVALREDRTALQARAFSWRITGFTDEAGNPADMRGWTGAMAAKETPATENASITFGVTPGLGEVLIEATSIAMTVEPRELFYDCYVSDPSGERQGVRWGYLKILPTGTV